MIGGIMLTAEMATASQISRETEATIGEREFESFYRTTSRSLWSYLYKLTGDGSRSEDILQRAYIQFLRRADRGRSEEERHSFLYRIATNMVYDEWREEKRRASLPAEVEARPASAGAEGRHDVRSAFSRLDERERVLLWLAHVEGESHRQIAGLLGLKEKSVKVLLYRARRKFAEVLERLGIGPEALS